MGIHIKAGGTNYPTGPRERGASSTDQPTNGRTHLGKADVVADAHPDLEPPGKGAVHHRDAVPARERVRLLEGDLPRHVDVEEVHFPVFRQDAPV